MQYYNCMFSTPVNNDSSPKNKTVLKVIKDINLYK